MFGKSKIAVFQKGKPRIESDLPRPLATPVVTEKLSPAEELVFATEVGNRKKLFDLCQESSGTCHQHVLANAGVFTESVNVPLDTNGNRLLHLTASHNDYTLTALLLQKGADPNMINNSGISPVMVSKRMGYTNITNLLCHYGGILPFKEEFRLGDETNVKTVDSVKCKAIGSESDQEFASKVLLPLPSNTSMLSQGLFLNATEKQDLRISSTIRSRGADDGSDESRKNAFQRSIENKVFSVADASYMGFYEALSNYLTRNNVDAPDTNGCTPLMKAAYRGHLDLVKLLLGLGTNVNNIDNHGHTALVWATLSGRFTIVKLLCEQGSLVDGVLPETKCMTSSTNSNIFLRITPLVAAIHGGHFDIFEYLILQGANINIRIGPGRGKTALMIACCLKKLNFVQSLLKYGAEVDLNFDQWLPRGVILTKKFSQQHNPWTSPLPENPSTKRENACLSAKLSLQDKLLYLTPEENEVIVQISHMLEGTWQTTKSSELSKHSNEPQPKSRLTQGRRRNNTFRQGLNLEKIIGSNSEQILQLAERMPVRGTELDELWVAMFKCVVQLVMAANKNIKHQYIAISAKAVHSASEIVRAVESENATSSTKSSSKNTSKTDSSWFQDTPVRIKIKQLCNVISTEFPKQLMLSTRLAIGMWPPANAISQMISEASSLAATCHELVHLANTLGNYPVLDKTFELSFDAFDDSDATSPPKASNSDRVEENHDAIEKRPKGAALNYNEYKRQNDMKLIEEMSKKYDVGHNYMSSQDGLNATEERAADLEFFRLLDERLKQFVASVTELKLIHDQHLKENFVNATSVVYEKADYLMEEVRNFEILSEFPDDLMFHIEDITRFEELGVRLKTLDLPCAAKGLYLSAFDEVKIAATQLIIKGKIAADPWPPKNAAAEMLQSTIPCVLCVKKLVLIAKESTTKIRETHSEERRKKDMWRKECLQNQKVKQLFSMWESQVLGEQTLNAIQDTAVQAVTIDELKLFGESIEGLVTEDVHGKRLIKGGRLAKMVEAMTSHISKDDDFMAAFLMTHHSFTTSNELLDQLFKRYDIAPPYGLNQAMFETYVDKKIVPVRLRVCAALQHWIVNHFEEDFQDYEALILRYKHFVEKKVAFDFENTSISLIETLNRKLSEDNRSRTIPQLSPERDRACPRPLLPSPRFGNDPLQMLALDPKVVFEFDPLEVARQLTLIEFSLFARVKPYECLDQIWDAQRRKEAMKMKPSSEPKRHVAGSPTSDISKLINHTNRLTFWIATMILRNEALKTRMSVLKFFVSLALNCKELNNLTGVTTIVGALSMAPISRLHKTWKALEDKYPKLAESYKELADIVSPKFQYANYRKVLKEMSPPAIPFLGVYLTDLTFIELGNPDFLPDSHFINFDKRRKVFNLIQEVQRYQQVPFAIVAVPQLQDFLNRVTQNLPRSKLDEELYVMNDDELYEQSLIVEPKETSDDDDDD